MRTNITSSPDDPIVIRICEVKSVEDDKAGLRIKVRLEPEDGDIDDDANLPYCFPLMPKMFHVNPKVGETVLVFLSVQGRPRGARFFLGPLIAQPYNMDFDPYNFSSRCLLPGFQNIDKPLPNPALNPENEGTTPDREDIALVGRKNTMVMLKDIVDNEKPNRNRQEIRLMCGHQENTSGPRKNLLNFNRKDPSYIQMRYKKMQDKKKNEFASVINIVADRINLLSHQTSGYTLNDKKDLITNDELTNIMDTAHPMVYGDQLIQYLKELITFIRNHGHNFTNEEPVMTDDEKRLLNAEERLDEMLSPTIRFN